MSKQIIIVSVAAFLLFSIPAMATESWLFADEALHMTKTRDDGYIPEKNGDGYLVKHSPGDDTNVNFNLRFTGGMMGPNVVVNGVSISNGIGDWIDATEDRYIRFSFREYFVGPTYNSDVLNFSDTGVEFVEKHAATPEVSDSFGLADPDTTNKDTNLIALESAYGYTKDALQTRYLYVTEGLAGLFDGNGNLTTGQRPGANWGTQNGSGYARVHGGTSWYQDYTWDYDGSVTGEVFGSSAYMSSSEWYLDVTISSTTYSQKFTDAYNGTNYPTTSGTPFVWYDDYYLYTTGGYTNLALYPGSTAPTALGNAGRWVLVRDELLIEKAWAQTRYADIHAGDVMVDMNSTSSTEHDKHQYFELAWKIAGTMVGEKFWNDNPNYYWSNELGAVCQDTSTTDAWLVRISMPANPHPELPIYTWNAGTSTWDLPATETGNKTTNYQLWALPDGDIETLVAGYDTINNFMKWVFDIDSLVIEDVDGDGAFDVGDDYILFSVNDDGMFYKVDKWGKFNDPETANFDGQYFDGDLVFLYDGNTITTWFAPYNATSGTAIFFGQEVTTTAATLMAGYYGDFDIDALDIGIIPEPSTILLMLGSATGLAAAAAIVRRKLR